MEKENIGKSEKKRSRFVIASLVKSMFKDADRQWNARTWWFGLRGKSFIGVFCTGVTTCNKSDNVKDTTFEVTRKGPKVPLVVGIIDIC